MTPVSPQSTDGTRERHGAACSSRKAPYDRSPRITFTSTIRPARLRYVQRATATRRSSSSGGARARAYRNIVLYGPKCLQQATRYSSARARGRSSGGGLAGASADRRDVTPSRVSVTARPTRRARNLLGIPSRQHAKSHLARLRVRSTMNIVRTSCVRRHVAPACDQHLGPLSFGL